MDVAHDHMDVETFKPHSRRAVLFNCYSNILKWDRFFVVARLKLVARMKKKTHKKLNYSYTRLIGNHLLLTCAFKSQNFKF